MATMTEPELPTPNSGTDRFGKFGMAAVGFAAAVLSFQTWVLLAKAVGFTASFALPFGIGFAVPISWLYPIAVDWYAVVVTRIWLRAVRGSRVAKFAKKNSIGAIILAVGSQGIYHAMRALKWNTGEAWPFVIIVGGMPPVFVGLVAHLYYELANERAERAKQGQPDVLLPEPKPEPAPTPAPEPVIAAKVIRKPRPAAPKANGTRTPQLEPGSNVRPIDRRTDEEVAAAVREFVRDHRTRTGRTPGRHVVAQGVRIAYGRTRELIDNAVRELESSGDDEEHHTSATPQLAEAR